VQFLDTTILKKNRYDLWIQRSHLGMCIIFRMYFATIPNILIILMISWSCVLLWFTHFHRFARVYAKCDFIVSKIFYYPFHVRNIYALIIQISGVCSTYTSVRDTNTAIYQYSAAWWPDGYIIFSQCLFP